MEDKNRERWRALCEQAAVEQDPERLMLLIQEIDQLLTEKQAPLKQQGSKSQDAA